MKETTSLTLSVVAICLNATVSRLYRDCIETVFKVVTVLI